jgi:hypothetical protein
MSSKLLHIETAINEVQQRSLAKAIASKLLINGKECLGSSRGYYQHHYDCNGDENKHLHSNPNSSGHVFSIGNSITSGLGVHGCELKFAIANLRPTSLVLWYRDSLSSLQKSSTGAMTGPISQPGGTQWVQIRQELVTSALLLEK